jgi:predicted hydrolase (HD superfamily)
MIMDRKQAWALLNEYVSNPALIRHGLAVEAAMRHYARLQDADEELWGVTGLLHDFDYERHPDPPEHTRAGAKILPPARRRRSAHRGDPLSRGMESR